MKKRPYLPTILWALLILILCGTPGKDVPHLSFLEEIGFDKVVHASIFFILVLFFIRSNKLQKNSYVKANAVFIAAGLSIPYGGITEILQATIFSGRDGDVFDFIADGLGCVIASLSYGYISKKIPKLRLPK
ncbi:MAG TPA: VanZ family protein [Bacteroidia bacterium]|nr:VanZ family protein [Bacteroidia bacterium]